MGGFASALQGLGGVGADIAQGRQQFQDQRTADAFNKLKMKQDALNIATIQSKLRQAGQPEFLGTAVDPTTKATLAILRDPASGQIRTQALMPGMDKSGEQAQVDQMLQSVKDPQVQSMMKNAYGLFGMAGLQKVYDQYSGDMLKPPPKPPAPKEPTEFSAWVDAFTKQHGRPPNANEIALFHRQPRVDTGGELSDDVTKALADQWQNNGIVPPAKNRAAVEAYLESHGMAPKVKLTAQEQGLLDLTKQIEPKVKQLQSAIESSGMLDKGGIWDAAKQAYEVMKYKRHLEPDKPYSDLIKTAAALQVMGAGPWMRIGRGKYLYETIQQHLPSPLDTPQLLYDKVNFLQGIVDEARASLPQQPGAEDHSDVIKSLFDTSKLQPATTP